MQLNITVKIAILSSAVNPEGSSDANSSVMSCLSAVDSQLATLLSVPSEILFLQHRVFYEYAKIAVGPDFSHTLPSFVIVAATFLALWKHPPSFAPLRNLIGVLLYKIVQVLVSWLMVTVLLWLWLVLQRVLYCSVWYYWSYTTEHQDISYPWWQHVWSSYYPVPTQPPVMSACFISWIIAMSIGIFALVCAMNINRLKRLIRIISIILWNALLVIKFCVEWMQNSCKAQQIFVSYEANVEEDNEELTDSAGDDSEPRLEMATNVNATREDVHPISYGTNWMPPPNFSKFQEAQRKIYMKSFHTLTDVNDVQNPDKFAGKQFRQRRNSQIAIPGNFNEQSSRRSRD